MRNRYKKGGFPFLGIIAAVVMLFAFFLHMGMGVALQAADGPLRWESTGQGTTVDDNNQVTLTFTLVGGDNVVGEISGAAFTLTAPVGGWTVVASSGFDMAPHGPAEFMGGPVGYVAMGNVLGPVITIPHVVTLTLQFAQDVDLADGILFDVVGRFDHGGPPLFQNLGSLGGGITIYLKPTIEASFDLISTSFAWSEKLTSIVIDLGEDNRIATSELDKDTFTVIATHLRVTGPTPAWMAMNEMERVVRNIYASNVNEEGYPANEGRYIVVEFMVWGPYRGLATGDGGATPQFHFRYNVTANEAAPLCDSNLTLLDFDFVQSGSNEAGFGFSRNAIIDQFEPTIGRTFEDLPGSLTYSTFLSRDENGEPLNNRPLFIHLHGGGQGNHWRQPLGYSNHGTIFAKPRWQERYQTHILVPANYGTDTSFGILPAVIREMIGEGLVDPNRVYISGYSAGSTATINYMIRHAELFAAAVPIANDPLQPGGVIDQEAIDIIKDIPMWWFNSEGEYSNNGLIRCWVNLELFFGRAGKTLTARACRVNPETRPGLNEPITVDGLGNQLTNSRYTRFWDNNIAKFPYGPDIWLAYLPHNEITDDGFWIFNGHQSWIPAFNDGLNVMEVYTIGWEPHARYDGFTPGDSTTLFDWIFAQCRSRIERPEYTLTFHLYTANQTIWDAFADYTTDEVDGRPVVVVPVVPGTCATTWDGLEEVFNLQNIYGTVERYGYAVWGWFTDEMLDDTGRTRDGLRRPALTVPDYLECYVLADLFMSIEYETAEFVDGNIDVYRLWVRWGDLDDNGVVNMTDLNLLQRHVNLGHVLTTAFSEAAADVVVDSAINMADLHLHQRYINFGHIIPVALGTEPQPQP